MLEIICVLLAVVCAILVLYLARKAGFVIMPCGCGISALPRVGSGSGVPGGSGRPSPVTDKEEEQRLIIR